MIEWSQAILLFSLLNCFIVLLQGFVKTSPDLQAAFWESQFRTSRVIVLNLILMLGCLLISFLTKDMSVKTVFQSSSFNTPLRYRISGVWGSLQGSHLLWITFVGILGQISLKSIKGKLQETSLISKGLFLQALMMGALLMIAYWITNPFERMLPIGDYGRGLNALLQNPYMVIHPPILFMGYSSLFNTFFLSLLWQLSQSKMDQTLLKKHLRFWAGLGWVFLTSGICLGCRWAYLELGWGGYWAWDPVENSSLMPWLALTLGLHMIQKNQNFSESLARYLFSFSFILTFFGTFLTRSSLVVSVHSFAKGAVGPAYLGLLIFFLSITFAILRPPQTTSTLSSHRSSSRHVFFNYGLLSLFTLFAITLIGTCGPIFYELLTHKKITLQEPFYNAFLPLIGGLILISLTGWSLSFVKKQKKGLIAFFVFSVLTLICVLTFSFYPLKAKIIQAGALITFAALILQAFYQSESFLKKLGFLGTHGGLVFFISAVSFGTKNRFQDLTFEKQNVIELWDYHIQHKGLKFENKEDEVRVSASLWLQDQRTPTRSTLVHPGRSRYSHDEQWYNEVDRLSTWFYDLYFSLHDFDLSSEKVEIRLYFNGGLRLVWLSFALMILGGLLLTFNRFFSKKNEVLSW
jgi:c-type cytochrome biogenesis protein CcmF